MSDVAQFAVRPPLRCFYQYSTSQKSLCGAAACWFRPGPRFELTGFYCRAHHRIGDVPIPDDVLFRRVAVSLEILLSAAAGTDALARAEAVGRVEEGVERLGGLVNLHAVTSVVGHLRGCRSALT